MFQHLLIATDGSDLATKAVQHGLALAKVLNAKTTAITVTEPWSSVVAGEMALAFPPDEYDKSVTANALKILAQVEKFAELAGVPCDTMHVKDQFPAEGIVETANGRGCDLIVMASHGRRGLKRLLLGSQAQKVVTHGMIPVLIYR